MRPASVLFSFCLLFMKISIIIKVYAICKMKRVED